LHDLTALAAQFRRFAELECEASPLYREITSRAAEDEAVLSLAAEGSSTPLTNLLLAAVHYLVLKDPGQPLGRFYPSVGGSAADLAGAYAAFRVFALDHAGPVRALLTTRRVQTNEVARAAVLLPGFGLIAGREPGRPLALVEVGTSAGLLLHWDRYAYDYGDGVIHGAPDSPLTLRCDARGAARPPVPQVLPAIVARIGLDLNPIDVRDPEQALWLRALVWPDQTDRAARLEQAIAIAAQAPPTLIRGDGTATLPAAVAGLPEGAIPCVLACFTLNQFDAPAREAFFRLLAEQSRGRSLYFLSLEYLGSKVPLLRLHAFHDGVGAPEEVLARCQGHASWIEWGAGAVG
jgi:hypothetical protein